MASSEIVERIRMSKLSQFTILTTNRCTAFCDHCSMHSSPQRRGKVALSTITQTVDQLMLDENHLEVVVFAGGEPTLLRNDLFDAIAYCHEKGLKTRIVTNASWATTMQKAEAMINTLRECRLSEVNYSLDDYHARDINYENVFNAWRASKNKGFDSVVIANCYGHNSTITSDFIQRHLGETIPVYWDENGTPQQSMSRSADGTRYLISNARLQRLGRGIAVAEQDIIYPRKQSILNLKCPWAVNSAALSAGSHLLACCGINAHGNEFLDFGDVRNANAAALLHQGAQRLVIQAIRKFGPWFLMKFVSDIATKPLFKPRYASVCEICEDVVNIAESRQILRDYLPEIYPLYENI